METSPKGRSPRGRSPEPVEPVETAPETEGEAERRWDPWLRDFEGFDPGILVGTNFGLLISCTSPIF